ncbi:magnesium transporter NIPA-domain-containing protein [Pavlovales sp. CCMP2436]|nr:magnesium transporter NIPA-domain-containing protein [Pavlovales sp. CCMP2436]|mmetsp:Transcript_12892/g.32676  ORF Transcript_12892/g.32676 Transcript_12892/m.32676 type:complete len:512 (+) Transcript_12892:116-1651(+)
MASASSVLFVTAQLGPDLPGTNITSASAAFRHHLPHPSFNTQSAQLVIGIVLATMGNLVISVSLNVQKYVHNLNDAKPEAERRPFTANPIWWFGLVGTVVGEVGNFLAFGFAGADIVTPLGAVAVVSNAVIACVFLGELFRIRDALGVLLTVLGSVLVVIKAPASEKELSVDLFIEYATNPIFVGYMCTVLALGLLIWNFLPRLRERHPAYGLLLCSLLGTVTVLCSTALSNFIRVTVNGEQQFDSWLPYALITLALPCGVGQVRYLNETMELYDNTQVVPIYYILFTLSTITGSAMLYQDFYQTAADAVVFFTLGCMLCFAGVALLTSGRVYVDEDVGYDATRVSGELQLGVEAGRRATDESLDLGSTSRRAKRRRASLRSMRHALRHLDSPLFQTSPKLGGSAGLSRADSFDSLYQALGNDTLVSAPRRGRQASDPPFGGGEHRNVWASAQVTGRSSSEDISRQQLRYTGPGPMRMLGRNGPPLPTHRRSRSDGKRQSGGVGGLLDEET